MKLLTFRKDNVRSIGIMSGEDVLDINAAFYSDLGGSTSNCQGSINLDMLSLLDMGTKGLSQAKKALEKAGRLDEDEKTVLREEGILHGLKDVKLEAPIPDL